MSTSQTDGRKGSQTYQRNEPTYAQNIAQTPPPQPPHPPRPPRGSGGMLSRGWFIGPAIVLVLLLTIGAIVFAQIASQGQKVQVTPTPMPSATQSGSPQATATPGGNDLTPTPAQGVVLGPQTCPTAVADPAHWNAIVGMNNGERSVEGVSCANIMDNPSLQALVKVRHTNGTLDVYVFDKITTSQPPRVFLLQGLVRGDAKISGYNTIMTAEVDTHSALNMGKSIVTMTPDLFREFDWSSTEGTLVQTAFPGIYPDLTRYQAERDQQAVSNGQDQWKYDAAKVAKNLAVALLKWSTNSQTTVVSGGGPQSVDAVMQVRSTGPDHPIIAVTLSRLEGNTNNIWCATAVTDGTTMSITSPAKWAILSSPVTVEGTGSAFEGDVGTVYVLDHLYTDIGHAKGVAASGMGKTTFTATIPYTATFRNGVQDGVLAYYSYSAADGAIAGCVMQKVLITA